MEITTLGSSNFKIQSDGLSCLWVRLLENPEEIPEVTAESDRGERREDGPGVMEDLETQKAFFCN